MITQPFKLYVWEDALADWSAGMIIALAPNLRAAKAAVRQAHSSRSDAIERDLRTAPKVIRITENTAPQAWLAWGGG